MTEHKEQSNIELSELPELQPPDTELSVPVGVPVEAFTELLKSGRERKVLPLDDVMSVLRDVELSPDVIDTVRHRLAWAGIELDETVEETDPHELLKVLPPEPAPDAGGVPATDPTRKAAPTAGAPASTGASSPAGHTREGTRAVGGSADPVRTYLKEIGKVDLLDGPEEVRLAQRIEAGQEAAARLAAFELMDGLAAPADPGDVRALRRLVVDGQRAKKALIEANLRLVVSIGKRYTGRGLLFLDLLQKGNLGLIRTVEKSEYSKGCKFSHYRT